MNALIYVLLVVVEVFTGTIPSALLYPIGGLIFGPTLATSLILIATVIGACMGYIQGRTISLYVSDQELMQNRDKVKMRKVASKAASIFSRCLKVGNISRSVEDRTLMEIRLPKMPKRPREDINTPSMKNSTVDDIV